jgi:hypothetical protein
LAFFLLGIVCDVVVSTLVCEATGSLVIQVALPQDSAAQLTDASLRIYLDKQAQPGFDGGAFCGQAAGLQGLSHKIIIDQDVCTHRGNPVMCISCVDIHIITPLFVDLYEATEFLCQAYA